MSRPLNNDEAESGHDSFHRIDQENLGHYPDLRQLRNECEASGVDFSGSDSGSDVSEGALRRACEGLGLDFDNSDDDHDEQDDDDDKSCLSRVQSSVDLPGLLRSSLETPTNTFHPAQETPEFLSLSNEAFDPVSYGFQELVEPRQTPRPLPPLPSGAVAVLPSGTRLSRTRSTRAATVSVSAGISNLSSTPTNPELLQSGGCSVTQRQRSVSVAVSGSTASAELNTGATNTSGLPVRRRARSNSITGGVHPFETPLSSGEQTLADLIKSINAGTASVVETEYRGVQFASAGPPPTPRLHPSSSFDPAEDGNQTNNSDSGPNGILQVLPTTTYQPTTSGSDTLPTLPAATYQPPSSSSSGPPRSHRESLKAVHAAFPQLPDELDIAFKKTVEYFDRYTGPAAFRRAHNNKGGPSSSASASASPGQTIDRPSTSRPRPTTEDFLSLIGNNGAPSDNASATSEQTITQRSTSRPRPTTEDYLSLIRNNRPRSNQVSTAGMNYQNYIESPQGANPRQAPSPSQGMNHSNGTNGTASLSGMMAGLPTPAGHQSDLNFLHQKVEELSRELQKHRDSTKRIIAAVDQVRERAAAKNLSSEDIINLMTGEAVGSGLDLEKENEALRKKLADSQYNRAENYKLCLEYASAVGMMLEQAHAFKAKTVDDMCTWHRSYRDQLAQERLDNMELRLQITDMNAHAANGLDLLNKFRRGWDRSDHYIEMENEILSLKRDRRFWKRVAMPELPDDDSEFSDDDDVIDPVEKVRQARLKEEKDKKEEAVKTAAEEATANRQTNLSARQSTVTSHQATVSDE